MGAWLSEQFGLSASPSSVSGWLRGLGFRYRRMRRAPPPERRDAGMAALFAEELRLLGRMDSAGEIDLLYYDETGFGLEPNVPYGWQQAGRTHRLASQKSRRHTLCGFMDRRCGFAGFRFEGAANSETTIYCFEQMLEKIQRKTIVVLDNASIHTSRKVMDKAAEWREKGLFLQFIPPYCPHLNLIERLWRDFKMLWLDEPGYFQCWKELGKAIDRIAAQIGTKYTINFK